MAFYLGGLKGGVTFVLLSTSEGGMAYTRVINKKGGLTFVFISINKEGIAFCMSV